MTDHCLDPLEIGDIARLPDDDPRRRHLDSCPRCRGLARALDIFQEPGDTSDLENLADTDAELQARLAAALASPATAPVRPAARASERTRRRWPAMAVAAVLVLCALGLTTSELLRLRDGALPELGRRQRGEAEADDLAVVATASGLRLTWPGVPTADAVVYVFMSPDMTELGRRTAPDILQLAADDPLAAATYCQAFAVLQGDTVGRSSITGLATAGE